MKGGYSPGESHALFGPMTAMLLDAGFFPWKHPSIGPLSLHGAFFLGGKTVTFWSGNDDANGGVPLLGGDGYEDQMPLYF